MTHIYALWKINRIGKTPYRKIFCSTDKNLNCKLCSLCRARQKEKCVFLGHFRHLPRKRTQMRFGAFFVKPSPNHPPLPFRLALTK